MLECLEVFRFLVLRAFFHSFDLVFLSVFFLFFFLDAVVSLYTVETSPGLWLRLPSFSLSFSFTGDVSKPVTPPPPSFQT